MSSFILYDGQAKMGDTCAASTLDTAEDEKEARKSGVEDWAGHDAIWAEYDERHTDKGIELINERLRWDLPPAST